jgi:hypothetical protein
MDILGNKKMPKNAEFVCSLCNFKCSKKSNYQIHIKTKKHNYGVIGNKLEEMEIEKKCQEYVCDCGKKYLSSSGLWKHKKTCTIENINFDKKNTNTNLSENELIMMLIKDNSEFKNMMFEQNKSMMEIIKNGTHNTIISNNNNNKTFNLQLFLNETCKDAINLSDFVNQIKISLSDLEETGTLGYAEGISKVFIKNLDDIDFNLRPIHCSDSKREILYIKDNNEWLKDDEKKSNLTKAIKQVANKNIKQISKWQKLHPEYNNPDSKQNDKYMKIVLNSMSGSSKEEAEKNYEKIAKNIAKGVIIEKSS